MIRYINVGGKKKEKKMYFQHNIRCFYDFVGIRGGYGEFDETIVVGFDPLGFFRSFHFAWEKNK